MNDSCLGIKQFQQLYRRFDKEQQASLINNLAGDLGQVKNKAVQHQVLAHFYRADEGYGTRLTQAVRGDIKQVKTIAKTL